MNSDRKTRMNKFVKAIINTYNKKHSILASKHTQGSFQGSLSFNFVKTKLMWNLSITFIIYKIFIYHTKKEIHSLSPKKKKKKDKERTKEASK